MKCLRRVLIPLGIVVLVCGCTSTDPSSTTSTVLETTTTTTAMVQETTTTDHEATATTQAANWEEQAEVVLAMVDDLYTALNDGDLQTAEALIRGPEQYEDGLTIAVEGLHARFEYECTPLSERGVSCVERVTDDLYGPAGLTNEATVTYRYSDGQLATTGGDSFVCDFEPEGDALAFLMEFRVWAAETHPELEHYWVWGRPVDSPAAIPCTVYPFTNPENAIEVCQIVPEFVLQSEHWPVG